MNIWVISPAAGNLCEEKLMELMFVYTVNLDFSLFLQVSCCLQVSHCCLQVSPLFCSCYMYDRLLCKSCLSLDEAYFKN